MANKLHVRRGDTVKVIAGNDVGKTGKVVRTMSDTGRVLVQGVNFVKRHTRPTQTNQRGGVVEKEAPLNASNLMLVCDGCGEATRTGVAVLEDGSRVRKCKKCGETIERS